MEMMPYGEEIRQYVEAVKKKLGPKLIVLFGSLARGTFGLDSDVDILVVSDRLPPNFQKRSKLLFLLNETFAPIEPFGYTSEEFRRMLLKPHPTALSALSDGIVLHKENNYYAEVSELLQKALTTVRKEKSGWVRVG